MPDNPAINGNWQRGSATLDMDFIHDQYWLNGTNYADNGSPVGTALNNFISGAGATFTRAGTTNVTASSPPLSSPFYMPSVDSFVSRSSGTENITSASPPFYMNSAGESFVSRASSATYFDNTGTLQTASTNVARNATYSYNGSSWVANAGTLIEPAATNLITNSSSMTASPWFPSNATVTGNMTTAPDGTTTAATIIEDTSATQHINPAYMTFTANTTYTCSIFVKSYSGDRNLQLGLYDATDGSVGTVTVTPGTNTTVTAGTTRIGTATITQLSNGWARVSITGTPSVTSGQCFVKIINGTNYIYTGNGTSGLYVWGGQIEASNYPTSYIATSGSAVTRAADIYNVQPATYFDSTGTLQYAASNTARSTYAYNGSSWGLGGTLIEPSATNNITNNTMQGAVAADGVERTNNGTFSTTLPNVCSGGVTSSTDTLACSNGTAVAAQTISSITYSGTTATVTTGSAHGLAVGNIVTVSGATPSAYNGAYMVVTVPSSTTFTYTMASNPGGNASPVGSYTATAGGWAGTINGGHGSVTATSGNMALSGDGTNTASVYEAITTVTGYTYNVAVTNGSGNAVTVQAGTSAGGTTLLAATSIAGSSMETYQFIATGTTSYVQINNTSAASAMVTNLSVQSAGNLPTNWRSATNNGLAIQVIGTGTDSGINYIDVRFYGMPTSTTFPFLTFGNACTMYAASQYAIVTFSSYIKLSAGSLSNISYPTLNLHAKSSGCVDQATNIGSSLTGITSAALDTQRITVSSTASSFSSPITAYLSGGISFEPTAGQAIDVTFRIGMPQLEQSSYVTSVIPTSGSAITRAADVYAVPNGGAYFDTTGTLQQAAVNTPRLDYGSAGGNYPQGVLIEEGRTNSIRNNMMVGAAPADGVERTNNGTFSTTSPNVCSGGVTSSTNTLSCNNGSGTGWVGTINSGTGTVAASSGSMALTGDGSNAASVYEAIPTVSGYFYNLTVTNGSGNAVTVQAGGSVGASGLLAASSIAAGATSSFLFTANGTTCYVQINNASTTAANVTAVSVQSGGNPPTDWSISATPGLSAKILGVFTENGIPALRVNYSGTTVAATASNVMYDHGGPVITGLGTAQSFTQSLYVDINSGSLTSGAFLTHWGQIWDATNTLVVDSQPKLPSVGSTLTRYTDTQTTPSSGNTPFHVQYVGLLMYPNIIGNNVNVTLDVGAGQLELGAFPTSVIPTYGSAVTRAADVFTVPTTAAGANGAWYTQGVGTLGSVGIIPYAFPTTVSANPAFVALDDGTTNNFLENYINFQSSGKRSVVFVSGGSEAYGAYIASPLYTVGALCQEVIAFQANSQGIAMDGTGETAGSFATIPSFTNLRVGASRDGGQPIDGWVNRIWYMPTRQPDASLLDYSK